MDNRLISDLCVKVQLQTISGHDSLDNAQRSCVKMAAFSSFGKTSAEPCLVSFNGFNFHY